MLYAFDPSVSEYRLSMRDELQCPEFEHHRRPPDPPLVNYVARWVASKFAPGAQARAAKSHIPQPKTQTREFCTAGVVTVSSRK